jgi:peptidoglycan hydrolase-like protein with peptidoglycan-binding domain
MAKKKVLMILVSLSIVFGMLIVSPTVGQAALGDRLLYQGTSHNDVKELQNYLQTKGYFEYHTATGYFGPITEQAVKEFQTTNGLKVDGIAGPITIGRLKSLYKGTNGVLVKDLQAELKDLGYFGHGVTGIYGSITSEAVKSYQRDHGLVADGVAGRNTLGSLEKQNASTKVSGGQKELQVESTAYTASCEGCSGITKSGIDLIEYPDAKVIAADPEVIPLGSKVHVEGYGEAIVADTGGAISGQKIDVYIQHRSDALQWGRKSVQVTILD